VGDPSVGWGKQLRWSASPTKDLFDLSVAEVVAHIEKETTQDSGVELLVRFWSRVRMLGDRSKRSSVFKG